MGLKAGVDKMDNVVVVESPSKAKTINKYLGNNYKVVASFGHIRDLPSKDGSVLPDEDFKMIWQVPEESERHVKDIISALKGAKNLILASDPDREGEAIAWHIVDELESRGKLKGINIQRVTFNEITKSMVEKQIQNPRDIDEELVDAYMARRALDYLVGFSLSPVLWHKLPGSKSAGRVQSVALRLICERENEIEAFKPREYWSLKGQFLNSAGVNFSAALTCLNGEKLDKFSLAGEQQALDAKNEVIKHSYTVAEVDTQQTLRNPAPPFTTSTLQQEASRKLYMSAKKTMQIAQTLFEGVDIGGETVGLITYMRTDGIQIAKEAVTACRDLIKKDFGDDYLPKEQRYYKNKIKNAQEAHEAIRPTDVFKTPSSIAEYLSKEQFKLYELIWKRTVASQMQSAKFNKVTADIKSEDGKINFRAAGQTLLFDGFLKLYFEDVDDKKDTQDTDEDNISLPNLEKNEATQLKKVQTLQHFTQSPPRYSEASLVKKLEELGIGRPSTYASIISVLQDRNYVRIENRRFIPEDRGRIVTVFLENFFHKYVEYDFTANLENSLDDISAGKENWKQVLLDFWIAFKQSVKEADELTYADVLAKMEEALSSHLFPDEESRVCPSCKEGRLSLKLGKFGAFIGCSKYPECRYTRPFSSEAPASDDKSAQGEEQNGSDAKILGKDNNGVDITLRKGPYGYYVQSGEVKKQKSGNEGKRVGLLKGMKPDEVDLQTALSLLSLPKVLGENPDNGEQIEVGVGRFGPYVKSGKQYVSLPKGVNVLTISLSEALEVIASKPLSKSKVIGPHPQTKEDICYGLGRFGPYVKMGKVYASLPKEMKEKGEALTLEEAVRIIDEKLQGGVAKVKATKNVRSTKKSSGNTTKRPNGKSKGSSSGKEKSET